jgi:hypothetical protein
MSSRLNTADWAVDPLKNYNIKNQSIKKLSGESPGDAQLLSGQ